MLDTQPDIRLLSYWRLRHSLNLYPSTVCSSQYSNLLFVGLRGPGNLIHLTQCVRSLNCMVQYTVVSLCDNMDCFWILYWNQLSHSSKKKRRYLQRPQTNIRAILMDEHTQCITIHLVVSFTIYLLWLVTAHQLLLFAHQTLPLLVKAHQILSDRCPIR